MGQTVGQFIIETTIMDILAPTTIIGLKMKLMVHKEEKSIVMLIMISVKKETTMKKESLYSIKSKCDVCNKTIFIDEFGNGKACPNCGWIQSEESFQHPNIAGILNIPSLNNAINQFKAGKSATLANFNDFIETYKNYGEVEFTYQNIRYGVLFDDKTKKHTLLNIKTSEKQYFEDIAAFVKNAKIDNILLKDLWEFVTNTDFLQEI